MFCGPSHIQQYWVCFTRHLFQSNKRGLFYVLNRVPFYYAWPFCFYSETGIWPSYCQILTNLDKIWHTPIVVRNTLVG